MKKIIYYFLLLCAFQMNAQLKLTEQATVSVLTCGPGDVLFTAFGHSAFRIHDPNLELDRVYNYGTFDFGAPNFYFNFAKGNLTYFLSTRDTRYFLGGYNYEERWVQEQYLQLDQLQTQAIFEFLERNKKNEHKFYQYDFFYDNCATKIEDVVRTVLGDKVQFPNAHITSTKSHRDLIADYTNNFKWGKFGIDVGLGSVIDDAATKDDYKFLPDYIFSAFEHATLEKDGTTVPLVHKTRTLLDHPVKELSPKDLYTSPFSLLLVLSILISYITFKNMKSNKRSKWLDFSLYLLTGIIGLVVLLMWFATAHTATYRNFNFLWAFAPNLLIAFVVLKSKLPGWIVKYNYGLMLMLVIMLVLWFLKVQVFNTALIPLLIALTLRYVYLNKAIKN